MGGFIDDDLAGVGAWGFDPADIVAPVLFLHGGRDQVVPSSHSEWLARRCPSAELWLSPEDGHISIMGSSRCGPGLAQGARRLRLSPACGRRATHDHSQYPLFLLEDAVWKVEILSQEVTQIFLPRESDVHSALLLYEMG